MSKHDPGRGILARDDHLPTEIVKGLTTAASIWAVAAVGLAVGSGMFVTAEFATTLALALLVLGRPVKQRLFHTARRPRREILVLAQDASLAKLRPLLSWKLPVSMVLCGTPRKGYVSINRTQVLMLGYLL